MKINDVVCKNGEAYWVKDYEGFEYILIGLDEKDEFRTTHNFPTIGQMKLASEIIRGDHIYDEGIVEQVVPKVEIRTTDGFYCYYPVDRFVRLETNLAGSAIRKVSELQRYDHIKNINGFVLDVIESSNSNQVIVRIDGYDGIRGYVFDKDKLIEIVTS